MNPVSQITRLTDLNSGQLDSLRRYLEARPGRALPYHTLEFGNVIDRVFGYENLSLAAFDGKGEIAGFLPQWRKGNVIESVPWRDKGGPVFEDPEVLPVFIEETRRMVDETRLKGFVWKDFETELLDQYEYFVNVDIDLEPFTEETYWKKLSAKERNTVRYATKSGLTFKDGTEEPGAVDRFYELFCLNRKRLGVPVYGKELFEAFLRELTPKRMRIFFVGNDETDFSTLILFFNEYVGIEAFAASHERALRLKANDLMLHSVISFCLGAGIRHFDFGSDSPLQTGLINYKLKWLGKKRKVVTSFQGQAKEGDHNQEKYNMVKTVIRHLPTPLYLLASRWIVR